MCDPKAEGGMSFKELSLFNEALLGKQVWRLLHLKKKNNNKKSLFYRVFKPRFFPNCTIMEVKEGHGGSYTWKSILKGRDVIRRGGEMKGRRWRINQNLWR